MKKELLTRGGAMEIRLRQGLPRESIKLFVCACALVLAACDAPGPPPNSHVCVDKDSNAVEAEKCDAANGGVKHSNGMFYYWYLLGHGQGRPFLGAHVTGGSRVNTPYFRPSRRVSPSPERRVAPSQTYKGPERRATPHTYLPNPGFRPRPTPRPSVRPRSR